MEDSLPTQPNSKKNDELSPDSSRNKDEKEPESAASRAVLVEPDVILKLTCDDVVAQTRISSANKSSQSAKTKEQQEGSMKKQENSETIPSTTMSRSDNVIRTAPPGAVWVPGMDGEEHIDTESPTTSLYDVLSSSNQHEDAQMEVIVPITDEELHNEVIDNVVPRAAVITEKEIGREQRCSGRQWRVLILFLICMLLATAIGIFLAVFLSSDEAPNDSQSISSTLDQLIEATDTLYSTLNDDPSPFLDTTSPQYEALSWISQQASARLDLDPSFVPSESFDWMVTNYALYRLYQSTKESVLWETSNWFVDAPLLDYCSYDAFYSPGPTSEFSSETVKQCDVEGNFVGLLTGSLSLQGSIPNEVGLLTNLEFINLGNNGLTGTLPKSVGALTKLRLLDIHFNDLSGTLPSDLGQLTRLEEFRLINNSLLAGTMPTEFANLTSLRRIILSGTNLSGTLPDEFCDMVEERRNESGDESIKVAADCVPIECPCCSESFGPQQCQR